MDEDDTKYDKAVTGIALTLNKRSISKHLKSTVKI